VSAEEWREWVSCRLCGSSDLRVLFIAERSDRQVVRCRRCGFVFYDPQPSPAQAAAFYSAHYLEDEYPAARTHERIQLAHRRLARIEQMTGVGSLLDVGCGRGDFLVAARQRGWAVAGLDRSPAAARMAAATVPVFEGELTGPRPSGLEPARVVTLWDVLEHLTDPVAALVSLPRWLSPQGLLIVETQNVRSVGAAWMGRRWEQFVEFDLYHFSPPTLRVALERAGFDAIRIEPSDRFAADHADKPAVARPDEGLRPALARIRDVVWAAAGYDRFNVMVATARRPA
jgi:2-polyprenyl-3-methyl-5-hydroxy-6-metoxy-1,4-benzoquinol methylase